MEPIDDDAPSWQRVHGIGHRWHPSPAGRRGCLLLLAGALALIVAALVFSIVC